MLTRRQLLQRGTMGGAGLMLGRASLAAAAPAATGVTPTLRRWVERLPVPPVLDAKAGGCFTIAAAESSTYRFHRHLPPGRSWGYGGAGYLGPTVETRQFVPLTIEWQNHLDSAFLPNDPTLAGAVMPGEQVPIVTHVHGGENLPQADGTPLQWFTKGLARTGPHFISNVCRYTSEQRATMVWYHDHALGNTRTNVYAGLAGLYLVRDAFDTGAADNPLGLPAGRYEIPLVLQDKTFDPDGTMFYPTHGVTADHPQWVPEFFGDVAVVNGKIWPFVDVEPRRYRLRLVNGSQSRFYNLQFAEESGGRPLAFTQIGADGGFLRAPVRMTTLLMAPGERADVIIDFAHRRHASFVLTNDARTPYPAGAPAGLSQLMVFRVKKPLRGEDETTRAECLQLPTLASLPAPSRERVQHLSETLDPLTGAPIHLNVEDQPYLDAKTGLPHVTTMPAAGAVEDWLLVNTTADAHPIHLHLVQFEVIDRRPFDAAAYTPGAPIRYTGPAVSRNANENGLKDTVQADPGQVTRIRTQFVLPDEPVQLPPGVSNPQYVWHCHILEHEENDMMRAFEVVR